MNNLVCLVKGHKPDAIIDRFEDAWMGSRRVGNYESERKYIPITCIYCKAKIKADKNLTSWILNSG